MSQQFNKQAGKFTVNRIISEVTEAGNVQVTICREYFNKLIGKTPIIAPVAIATDKAGNYWKRYSLDGATLYARDIRDEVTGEKKTFFLMSKTEAEARLVPVVSAFTPTESFAM